MKLEEYLVKVWWRGEMFPDWPVGSLTQLKPIFARSFRTAFLADGGLKENYGVDISTGY